MSSETSEADIRVVGDITAKPGNYIPLLARLLRQLRDLEKIRSAENREEEKTRLREQAEAERQKREKENAAACEAIAASIKADVQGKLADLREAYSKEKP